MSVDDRRWSKWAARANLLLFLILAGCSGGGAGSASNSPPLPNIVLVVMDDIGIDQSQLFGYGGVDPAATPNIGAIANDGVSFHNMWAMPACSNGRAALFTGRYPFRTNVLTAIGNDDLANYMVNPNEITLPKLLKQRGYTSALFGKFHMGIQEKDPYGYAMVHALGFDYFDGWLDATGDPSSIDTTAGGVSPSGTWSCGFVRDAAHGGAEAPGRACRDSGGIFDPEPAVHQLAPGLYKRFDPERTLCFAAGDQQSGWNGRAGTADRHSSPDVSSDRGG